MNSPLHHAWSGLSFEMLCLSHLAQIKQSLGISGVQTLACSWRSVYSEPGAQIDLLIDRKDETVNVCEIKYVGGEFEITKDYEAKLEAKLQAFMEETRTRKSLLLTLITPYGVKRNAHSGIVQCELVLDDLF